MELVTVLRFFCIYFDLRVDAAGGVYHQLGLLGTALYPSKERTRMAVLENLCLMFVCFIIVSRLICGFRRILRFYDFCTESVGDGLTFVSSLDVTLCG